MCFLLFLAISYFQIYVISLAEPRLPLQLDDAIRPEVDGEEVKFVFMKYPFAVCLAHKILKT